MRSFHRFLPVLLFLLAIGLLGGLGTHEPSVDSYGYARSIRSGEGLLHPHHLAFNWVNHFIFRGLQKMGTDPEAIGVGRWHNIIAAALCLVFCFGFFRRIGQSPWRAFAAAVGLMGCFGFWKMATVVEVYVPGMLFLIAACWYLAGLPPDRLRLRDPLVLALLLTAAVLYHQTNVIFSLPLAVFLGLRYGRRGWKYASQVLVPAGILCLGLYLGAAVASGYEPGFRGVYRYMFHYELMGHEGWGSLSNLAPAGLFKMLKSQISTLIVGRYAVVFVFQLVYSLALFGLIGWNIRQLLQAGAGQKDKALRGSMLAWLGVHYLFFGWWLPQEGEFFVVSLFPLLVLLVLLLRDLAPPRRGAKAVRIALAVLVAGQWGLLFQYVFLETHSDQPSRQRAAAIAGFCPQKCFIFDEHFTVEALQYYHGWQGTHLELVLLKYYGIEPYLQLKDFSRAGCFLIEVERIRPGFDFRGHNGFSYPEEWWRLVVELVDLQPADDGRWVARIPRIMVVEGVEYLQWGPERKEYADPGAVLEELADELGAAHPAGRGFLRWAEQHRPAGHDLKAGK